MALKQSEKNLIGIMMIVGGLGVLGLVGLPQWDQFQANNFQKAELESKLTEAKANKDNLTSRIQLLEQRIAPPDVDIRKYSAADKERQIKEILDDVVRTATRTGNKFISLEPKDVPPVIPPPPPPENNQQSEGNAESAPPPPALLDTFGYELAIRGSYDTVQNFLRAMDQNKELMELSGIVLSNETAAADPATDTVDYSAPIRLTAILRLVMQPGGPSVP